MPYLIFDFAGGHSPLGVVLLFDFDFIGVYLYRRESYHCCRFLGRVFRSAGNRVSCFWLLGGSSPLGVELFVDDLTGVYFVALWIVLFSLLFSRFLPCDF